MQIVKNPFYKSFACINNILSGIALYLILFIFNLNLSIRMNKTYRFERTLYVIITRMMRVVDGQSVKKKFDCGLLSKAWTKLELVVGSEAAKVRRL